MTTISPDGADEIILEITGIGPYLRVAAMDPATLTEVVFQAPLTADQAAIAALARRKLAFVMAPARAKVRQPQKRR